MFGIRHLLEICRIHREPETVQILELTRLAERITLTHVRVIIRPGETEGKIIWAALKIRKIAPIRKSLGQAHEKVFLSDISRSF